jgi:hypothetical protein
LVYEKIFVIFVYIFYLETYVKTMFIVAAELNKNKLDKI